MFNDELRDGLLIFDNQTRKIHTLIRHLKKGLLNQGDGDTIVVKAIVETYFQTEGDAGFCQAILYLNDNTQLFDDTACGRAAVEIARDYHAWKREITSWKPHSRYSDKQLASLLRHLYAEHEVPLFMDRAWTESNRLHQMWYKHLGSGQNIRTAEGIPVVLTKAMAHHFLQAPAIYSIEAAIRWGQIHALGGDRRLCDALLDTRLAADFNDDRFWQSVLRFFIRNPMLDAAWINPIIDYIWSQKYEDQFVFVRKGVAENRGPAQPNFTMQGRTADTLMRHVEQWHDNVLTT